MAPTLPFRSDDEIVAVQVGRFWITDDGRICPVVRGGDGPEDEGEPEAIPTSEELEALDDEALRAAHTKLEERYQALRKDATGAEALTQLRAIREAQATIATTLTTRAETAAEEARQLAELDNGAPLPEPAPANPAEPEPTPAQATGTAPEAAGGATVPVPKAAALTPADIAANRTPQAPGQQRPSDAPARPRTGFVASAGNAQVNPGHPVDLAEIGLMIDAAKSITPGSDGKGARAYVAGLPAFEQHADLGVELLSMSNSTTVNDRIHREAVEDWRHRFRGAPLPAGRTAAICDPLDAIREVPDCSTDADPLGNSLPSRPAGRLGYQFTPAIGLADLDTGVRNDWDEAAQAAVDPDDPLTWKPCVHVNCPPVQNVRALAVTACFTFDITTEMSNPERVRDAMAKISALRVRRRTQRLLTIMDTFSKAFTYAAGYGAYAASVQAVESALARTTYDERIDEGDYLLYLPPGLVEAWVTDRENRAYVNETERTEAENSAVAAFERATGLRTVRLLDVVGANPFGALPADNAAAVALPELPLTYRMRLIAPEAALYFSTGEMNTGVEISPELMRRNHRQWFSEEYVGLTKHGCHPWIRIDATICPNGTRAGLSEPFACPPV